MTRFLPSVASIPEEYSLEHLLPHSQKNGKPRGFKTEAVRLPISVSGRSTPSIGSATGSMLKLVVQAQNLGVGK